LILPADDGDDDAVAAADAMWCHCCAGRLAIYSTPMTVAALIMDIHSPAVVSLTDRTLYHIVDMSGANVSEWLAAANVLHPAICLPFH